jgi:membrane protease YdiL (CAAX protease family)
MESSGRDRRYRPVAFFVAAYLASWAPWLVGAQLARQEGGEVYGFLFILVGLLLGPTGAALFFVLTSGSPALKRDFRDRILNLRRIRPLYALVAVFLPFALTVLAIGVSLALGESPDQFALAGGPGLGVMVALALVLAPILEETGWHGYGVDSLRAHASMRTTTLLFAVLWCVWHAPSVLVRGSYQHQLAEMDNPLFVINFFVSILPAAVVANWLYYKNRRSILGAVLFHAMLNGAAVLLNAGQVAKCIVTVLSVLVAAAIAAFDREFREGPRDFLPREPAAGLDRSTPNRIGT